MSPMRVVPGEVPQGGSLFPPIATYAFLSDCEVCALEERRRELVGRAGPER